MLKTRKNWIFGPKGPEKNFLSKKPQQEEERAKDAVLAAEEDAEAEAGKDIPLSAEEKKAQAQQTAAETVKRTLKRTENATN